MAGMQANPYAYAANNPLRYTDPTGLDIWIEGSSGPEVPFHQSINIGDPFGKYDSYSFAINGGGKVYEDVDKGGDIAQYLKTTPEQDAEAKRLLLQQRSADNKKWYGPVNNCRSYSLEKFEQFKEMYGPPDSDLPAIGPDVTTAPNRPSAPWWGWWQWAPSSISSTSLGGTITFQ